MNAKQPILAALILGTAFLQGCQSFPRQVSSQGTDELAAWQNRYAAAMAHKDPELRISALEESAPPTAASALKVQKRIAATALFYLPGEYEQRVRQLAGAAAPFRKHELDRESAALLALGAAGGYLEAAEVDRYTTRQVRGQTGALCHATTISDYARRVRGHKLARKGYERYAAASCHAWISGKPEEARRIFTVDLAQLAISDSRLAAELSKSGIEQVEYAPIKLFSVRLQKASGIDLLALARQGG